MHESLIKSDIFFTSVMPCSRKRGLFLPLSPAKSSLIAEFIVIIAATLSFGTCSSSSSRHQSSANSDHDDAGQQNNVRVLRFEDFYSLDPDTEPLVNKWKPAIELAMMAYRRFYKDDG
jgi:hypothetical protein